MQTIRPPIWWRSNSVGSATSCSRRPFTSQAARKPRSARTIPRKTKNTGGTLVSGGRKGRAFSETAERTQARGSAATRGSRLRRRPHPHQHEQAARSRILHAVRPARRREDEPAPLELLDALPDGELALPLDHLIELVDARVRVRCVRLARLEGLEPDHHSAPLEERRLPP